jgi:hypothetical protein
MQWLGAATVALLLPGVIAFPLLGWDELSKLGDFLGGFAAAVAFLWLVASVRFQSRELAMQRDELQLQRLALERQAEELRNGSKFSSLAQIKDLLERATEVVASSDLQIKGPSELYAVWVREMSQWKIIFESRNHDTVLESYYKWLKVEGVVRNYLSNVSLALKIYLEFHTQAKPDLSKSDEELIYIYSSYMLKAPFLSSHAGTANMLANFLVMYEPGLKAVQLGGMTAAEKAFGTGMFKEEGLQQLKDELLRRNTTLPAIVDR